MRCVFVALLALACGSAPEPCLDATAGPERVRLVVQDDGCAIGNPVAAWNACGMQLNAWSDDAECNHLAEFACADGMSATIIAENDWNSGRILYQRGGERPCVTEVTFSAL